MSKSLGNVVSPAEIVERYGTEATRYYLLREIPPQNDGDFSYQRMQEIYNSDLANELGNLVMRLTTLGSKDELSVDQAPPPALAEEVFTRTAAFAFNEALELIWKEIKALNKEIDGFEPWKKQPAERSAFLTSGLQKIQQIAYLLQPFMPGTAAIIMEVTSGTISKCPPLFPKKQ